jgi:RNA polymerase sigma-70 factor (ECF subfamily)
VRRVATVEEKRWLQAAQRGDTEAFAVLYRANVKAIFRYILMRVRDPQLAEDLTGDVFIRALKSIRNYEDQGKPFVAWLYRIAHARVVDHYRRQDRRPSEQELDDEPIVVQTDMDANMLRRQAANALRQAIQALTPEQQQVIVLRFMEGQRLEVVAEVMGKNANAIKALQHRALKALASRLEKAGFDLDAVLAGIG